MDDFHRAEMLKEQEKTGREKIWMTSTGVKSLERRKRWDERTFAWLPLESNLEDSQKAEQDVTVKALDGFHRTQMLRKLERMRWWKDVIAATRSKAQIAEGGGSGSREVWVAYLVVQR